LSFPVLAGVMMFRRVGEYALFRPAREMVFSAVDAETKYKSKNAIDTVVYRGGDLIAAWASAAIVAVASPVAAALAGAGVAVLWAWSGISVGRRFDRRPAEAPLS
jgi:AAA family ATP:ADP antiporter